MNNFDDLLKLKIKEILAETQTVQVPELLTAEEIEIETKGKIKKEQVWKLARNTDKNHFPVSRLGERKILVWRDEFWAWMKKGGVPLED